MDNPRTIALYPILSHFEYLFLWESKHPSLIDLELPPGQWTYIKGPVVPHGLIHTTELVYLLWRKCRFDVAAHYRKVCHHCGQDDGAIAMQHQQQTRHERKKFLFLLLKPRPWSLLQVEG